MPNVFDQDSVQYPSGDGTGQTSKIACFADVSIDPAPEYQKFFDEPYVRGLYYIPLLFSFVFDYDF